jgi:hypothetical protein
VYLVDVSMKFWNMMIRRENRMGRRVVAHTYNAEYLVVHQLLAAQWHRDASFGLVLGEFAVIMAKKDAQNERKRSKRGSRRE